MSQDKLREEIQLLQKDRAKLKTELKESLVKKPTSAKNRAAPPASSSDSKPKRVVVFDQLETASLLKQFKPYKNKLLSDHFFSEKLNASLALLHSESGTSEALSISVDDVLAQSNTPTVTKNVRILIKYAELSNRDPESLTDEERRQRDDANQFFRLLSTQATQTPEGCRLCAGESAANILPTNQTRSRVQYIPPNVAGKSSVCNCLPFHSFY
jgi:hypothetical protein